MCMDEVSAVCSALHWGFTVTKTGVVPAPGADGLMEETH